MPPRPASEMPIIQARAATCSGLPPNSRSSSGLSTEARIAVPTRVRVSSTKRPAATTTEAMIVISWWAVRLAPPTLKLVPAKNGSTVRDSSG